MYRDILLAYDGSRDGREALQQGTELARECKARVLLLAVARPSDGMVPIEGISYVLAHEYDKITADLLEGLAILRDNGLSCEAWLSVGHPVERITTAAREIGADLIVVGHRNQSTLGRWWTGSVGASVLSRAPCSVLVAVKTPLANARMRANWITPGLAPNWITPCIAKEPPTLRLVSERSDAAKRN